MNNASTGSQLQVISNKIFLKAIFGDNYKKAHCTSFQEDPHNVARAAWGGKYYCQLTAESPKPGIEAPEFNNYFVISTFSEDPLDGYPRARRRRSLFEQCFLVVIDDVRAKVPEEKLKALGFPEPTYRLETSPDNEQWGYRFNVSVTQRIWIEHLLDSWVKMGISCDGKDPGMKGVTRYVRLPIGSNTKAVYGAPFRHKLRSWDPDIGYDIQELARMTGVNLDDAPEPMELRPQQILDDDTDPMLQALSSAGLLGKKIKPGAFEITCPWIDEHSKRADSGAAYFQPSGFRCFHGHCEDRTGIDLKRYLQQHGYLTAAMAAEEMFGGAAVVPAEGEGEAPVEVVAPRVAKHVYITSLDKFYLPERNLYCTRDQMNAMFPAGPKDPKYCPNFFENGARMGYSQVDRITYIPGGPQIDYDELNLWKPGTLKPVEGDVSVWLDLATRLFPRRYEREHILSWLAYTLQHPGQKINHCLLVVGPVQGQGKDTFIEPLIEGLGRDNCSMVFPKEFHGGYNDFLKGNKLLVVQEVMDFGKGDVQHYLKPLLAAPPSEVAISEKYVGRYMLPNLWNFVMFSNELNAAAIAGGDRRYFCVKTEAPPLGDLSDKIWDWYYNQEGLGKVYHYLLNYDISRFSPKGAPPMTGFKQEMIEASKTGIQMDLEALFESGGWEIFRMKDLLDQIKQQSVFGQMSGPYTSKNVGNTLRKLRYTLTFKKMGGKTTRIWVSPNFEGDVNEWLRIESVTEGKA